ncbi:MAG: hypothetical protein RQ856_05100, partial [Candidatus Izemoplasmatales bacterium]|nr:hypothetical protein [Candidatus Izemoplasmatales bacterium]
MGLDISYGSNIEKAGIKPNDDTVYDYEIAIWNEPCFEYQLGSLDRRYSYRWTSKSEHGSFRAGSYSGYNEWRRELIKMVGYDSLGSVCAEFGDKSF